MHVVYVAYIISRSFFHYINGDRKLKSQAVVACLILLYYRAFPNLTISHISISYILYENTNRTCVKILVSQYYY